MRTATILLAGLTLQAGIRGAAGFTIGKDQPHTIVIPAKPDEVCRFAAAELAKHLQLVFGLDVPIVREGASTAGSGTFQIGIRPPGDGTALSPEEARYEITPAAIYLYGDDDLEGAGLKSPFPGPDRRAAQKALDLKNARTGTLFAVYEFLEHELGVHWLMPGDHGIAYTARSRQTLRPKRHRWTTRLIRRHMRVGQPWSQLNSNSAHVGQLNIPPEFRVTEQQAAAREMMDLTWLRRMRMGCRELVRFGHSNRNWWKIFHEKHPEYFALVNGKRKAVRGKEDRVKLCISNPAVAEQKIQFWLREAKRTGRTKYFSAGPNDGGGFCECAKCRALDVALPGEKPMSHLTDRYVWYWNKLLGMIREHYPDAIVTAGAYSRYFEPPRRERLLPGIYLTFVAGKGYTLEQCRRVWKGWADAGVSGIFLRPNQLAVARNPIVTDADKAYFQVFRLGYANKMLGTDFGGAFGNWANASMMYYIMAKAHVDPTKSFEHWEDEYCAAYGAAAPEAKAYFQHWRAVHAKNPLGDKRYGGTLYKKAQEYYEPAPFQQAARILDRAAAKPLLPSQKALVQQLVLANRHNHLWLKAIATGNEAREKDASSAARQASLAATRELWDYRLKHKDELDMNWAWVFTIEGRKYGDRARIQHWRQAGKLNAASMAAVRFEDKHDRHPDMGDQ